MSSLQFTLRRKRRMLHPIDEGDPREPRSPVNTMHQLPVHQQSSSSVSERRSDLVSYHAHSVLVPLKKRRREVDADSEPVAVRVSMLSSSTPLGKPKHEVSAISLQKPVKPGSGSNSGMLKSQQSQRSLGIIKPCTCNRCKNSSANATCKQSSPPKNIPSQQQIDEGIYEILWHYDVKSRYGHGSKSQLQDRSGEMAWSVVHASSRNKKQHLRWSHNAESDSDDDGSVLSQESTTSYDSSISSSTTSQAYLSSSLHVRGEDSIYMHTAKELLDSMDRFNEQIFESDAVMELKDDFSESQKTKNLQAQIETLTYQNEQKDAKIKELKQRLKTTRVKIPRGRTGNLEWRLLRKPDGKLIELGSGSYGRVYKGHCNNTEKFLAVKVVQDLNNKKAADVLEKEVKQLSSLEPHNRIVTYLGTCYAKHPTSDVMSLYVFTEFMPGGSLSSFLAKNGPLVESAMWKFTHQILEGVDYLHECGIIHRDIKGSNIMTSCSCTCGEHASIKLADFGSAKQICSESLDKDKTKYLYGTAPWAAPELLRGEKACPESDIWSVGATVVEMLTGKTPYGNENFYNQVAIIYQVGSNKINPLTSMKKSGCFLGVKVESFLSSCFKSIAKDRPSAAGLLESTYWRAALW